MKKFLSIIRNVAHVGAGVLLASPDPRYQIAGGLLAAIATGASQKAVKAPKIKPAPAIPAGSIPLMCLAIGLFVAGCGTTPQEKVESAADIINAAAFNGTVAVLADKPQWTEHFRQAVQDLRLLNQSPNASLSAVVAIVQRLPVDKLGSIYAQLAIGNGTLILRRYERQIDLTREDTGLIIEALATGIETGLPFTRLPPIQPQP